MLELNVITPLKKVVGSVKVKSVTVPGEKGEITILEGHANLVSTLRTGIVQYVQENGQVVQSAVSFGFIEVREDKITLLCETLETSKDIDFSRAKKAQALAEKQLNDPDLTPEAFHKYQLKLQRSVIRQSIGGS